MKPVEVALYMLAGALVACDAAKRWWLTGIACLALVFGGVEDYRSIMRMR